MLVFTREWFYKWQNFMPVPSVERQVCLCTFVSFVRVNMCAYTYACISVCLSVSVWCMHVYVFMDGCMCVLKHVKARDWCQLSSSMTFYLCFWDQVFSEPRTHWLGEIRWPTSSMGSPVPVAFRFQIHVATLSFLDCGKSKLGSSCFWHEALYHLPPIPVIMINAGATRTTRAI